jgi:hypothetical protein
MAEAPLVRERDGYRALRIRRAMAEIPVKLIADRLREGRCVPFLGAAVNVTDDDRKYSGLPLGVQVAENLSGDLAAGVVRDPGNLARVSLQHERTNDRDYLVTRLKDIIPDQKRSPSPLLQTIAKLPFRLIVTTNYDRLLEQALVAIGRSYRLIVQTASGATNAPTVEEWAAIRPEEKPLLVYKIHGSFLDKQIPPGAEFAIECSSLIVTEDDYIDFISVLSDNELGVPQVVRMLMSYSTLLFLGYSLEDWDFRALYKSLVLSKLTPNGTRKSIAIQKSAAADWQKFWTKRDVDIYDEHVYRFAEMLDKAVNGAGGA